MVINHGCFCNFCRVARELEKEAQMCTLQHVNIVVLHAMILETRHYGIVMEYVLHGAFDEFIFTHVVCSVSTSYKRVHLFII